MSIQAAIHISSTAVCTAIGRLEHSGGKSYLKIMAVGLAHTDAFTQGQITYREHLRSAIHKSVQEAMDMSGTKIINPLISFATPLMASSNEMATVMVADPTGRISAEDLINAHQSIEDRLAIEDRAVLQSVQQLVYLQSNEQVSDAIGLLSKQIQVACHVVSVPATTYQQVLELALDQEIEASTTIFDGVAGSAYALTAAEKEQGVCFVDIGATMTKVCVYQADALLYTACLPVGGNTVDLDIAKECGIPLQDADSFKRQEGTLNPSKYSPGSHVIFHKGKRQEKTMLRRELNQVIEARYGDIFSQIFAQIDAAGLSFAIGSGVVLAGGGASMDGLANFVRTRFGINARMVETPKNIIFDPNTLSDDNIKLLKKHLADNTLHSAIGTLMYGYSEQFARDQQTLYDDNTDGFWDKIKQLVYRILATLKKIA